MSEFDYDLIVIGGGPAGMAAARRVAGHLSVAVIDEQPKPGGQILRQPPDTFRVRSWLPGHAYKALKQNLAAFEALDAITWLGSCSVVGLSRLPEGAGFALHVVGMDGMARMTARCVLVATGCYDLPVPIQGWTLPGVMAAGGAQAFMKSQQILPGNRVVLAGTHPLMLVIAEQIVTAGGVVGAVAFEQNLTSMLARMMRHSLTALTNLAPLMGAASALQTLIRHKVPVLFGTPIREVIGSSFVESARLGDRQVACDAVALCYGFVPQSDLTRMIGAKTIWAKPAGGWRTLHDLFMQTDIEGLFVAGETAGMGGAVTAQDEGTLAAIGICQKLDQLTPSQAAAEAGRLRRQITRRRQFADLLSAIGDPSPALRRRTPPDTIICRCEDVTMSMIDDELDRNTAPNAVKLATRIGMGLCQGRTCKAVLLRKIAEKTGSEPGTRGGFTPRFPIRPTRIADIAECADFRKQC